MTKPKIPNKMPEERPERIGPPIPILPERREKPEERPIYEPEPRKLEPTPAYYVG